MNVRSIGADDTANGGALVQQLSVAAAKARLYSLTVLNTGPDQWIQLHDSAAAPSAAAVPKISIPVGGSQFASFDFNDGRLFRAGIFVVNSTTAATYTAGAADCLIDASFRKD